ncbi:phytoene/squalene synthase family protein [Rubrobacter indicoceani]|uniref:phytoene/squalene synthase family protein n=1 Tax=Rubrobacter indicoceani TaxID=2051957 RepID=UPI0013C51FA3|nr:phytoene/squalene synthase family protein [Rubrobacter indicoceani]
MQREHSKTYHFATRLFPKAVRRHVYALYAFMRYADELVDNPGPLTLDEQHRALDEFEAETYRAVEGEAVLNPVLRAYAETVRECGIENRDIRAFLASMKMDTHVFRYRTFRDLEGYTYGSAAVVGLMMCRVVGARDERARPHAEALGTAMQLTNFLRDIGEDWKRGRIYIPQQDMKRFGYAETDLKAGTVDDRFRELIRFESERARSLYAVADAGMKYIPEGRRYPVAVSRALYSRILALIEERDFDVFSGRARTSVAQKFAIAGACATREPQTILARVRETKPGRSG